MDEADPEYHAWDHDTVHHRRGPGLARGSAARAWDHDTPFRRPGPEADQAGGLAHARRSYGLEEFRSSLAAIVTCVEPARLF